MKVNHCHNITINNVFCDKMRDICDACELKAECRKQRKAVELCRTCKHAISCYECDIKKLQAVTITTAIPPSKGTIITECSSYEERPIAVTDRLE